ncbi:MAG: outer membrane protein assembly factor BamB family protein [Phycisphaerae bacterium]
MALAALWAVTLVACEPAGVQAADIIAQPIRINATPTPGRNASPDSSPVIQVSEEAASLMARAREGVERRDWKLAIDSLQRIVELSGEHILRVDDNRYEMARIQAHRQIAALPIEGLQAYRTLNDAEAAMLFEEGLRHHDAGLLTTVVHRYLLTSSGDDAAVTLAEWLMDAGRFFEAAALLRTVRLIYPDSDLPGWLVPARLTMCFAAMGQQRRAEEMLAQMTATQAASSLPREKVQQLREFISKNSDRPQSRLATSWPMACGNVCRDGVQHVVEPSLVEQHCMAAMLPIPGLAEMAATLDEVAAKAGFIPGRHIVTHEDLVIVKAARNLVALDANTLTPVWTTKPPIDAVESPMSDESFQILQIAEPSTTGSQDLRQPQALLALACAANSDVVIAEDKVLTLVFPEGAAPTPNLQRRQNGNLIFWPSSVAGSTWPNHVQAYALRDGSFLWQSDTAGFAGTATAPAGEDVACQFLATPVPAEGHLLAPCKINNDLYLVALDPATGKHAWHVFLCGMSTRTSFSAVESMRIAISDKVAFVLTGQGLLVAVELSGRSVLWAIRYPRRETTDRYPTGEIIRGDEPNWPWEPPVATADVLLAAPVDANHLFCIDRFTGDVRWQVELHEAVQILGVDRAHVWLAGNQLQMIDLHTGLPVWTKPSIKVNGRGSLSGDRIYLPTAGGLIALQAKTGEPVPLKGTGGVMSGNLLAWDGALYSVGISEVRKYPDLGSGYKAAVARHQADPANPSKALRLAGLELLLNKPAAALEALALLGDDLKTSDPWKHGQAVHLRVEALLTLAADEKRTEAEAEESLKQARAIAESAEDRIRTALAMGDHLRLRQRLLEACEQYLSLALSPAGDQMVSLEKGLEQKARLLANQRLAAAISQLPAEDRKTLANRARQHLSKGVNHRDADSLRRLMDCPAVADAPQEARLHLATWAIENLQFEQAESLLRQILNHGAAPATGAEAAARLAAICLLPAELHQPATGTALVDRLEVEWADVEIPADALADPLESATQRPASSSKVTGRVAADTLRRRLDASSLARPGAVVGPCVLGPLQDNVRLHIGNKCPLIARNDSNEAAKTTLVSMTENKVLEARRLGIQTTLWQTELRLSEQPAVDVGTGLSVTSFQTHIGETSATRWAVRPAAGVLDGQTLIVNTGFGLHGVGLLTGRRLWSRPFDPPCAPGSDPIASDLWLWSHDGYLISLNASGRVEVARSFDGAHVLWSRSMPKRQWHIVRARGSYVIAADEKIQEVDVFRLADGQHIGQCRFSQPQAAADRINLLLFDEVICGPVSENEVAAFELASPGTERWRTAVTGRLSQIFKPTADLAAIADRAGQVEIRESSTGKARGRFATPTCAEGVIDGALADGVFYLIGYFERPARRPRRVNGCYGLAAIRMEDGTILWQRNDIAPGTFLTADVLRMSSNAIPLAMLVSDSEAGGTSRPAGTRTRSGTGDPPGSIEMCLLDKATGKEIGRRVSKPLPTGIRDSLILDVCVWGREIIVRMAACELRFAVETPRSGPALEVR